MPEPKACCTPSRAATNTKPSARIAPGMTAHRLIALPGGPFRMGTNYAKGFTADGEGPVRTVSLSPFEIAPYPVTNSDFAAFVQATGYVSDAERYGTSFVFQAQIPPEHYDELVEDTIAAAPWWCLVRGASWQAPEGPGSDITNRLNHPVVHVSWNDATAYADWSGQQLPSEAQWEYAARGGHDQALYPWGDELTPGGQHRCNIWQGDFPTHNSAEDGFAATCPVDAFPPNAFGLYSMTGNTWEWCADYWGTSFMAEPAYDPRGPAQGIGRVMKGGSFLCHASYCNRYRIAARTQNTPDSSASNIGFRCVSAI